MIGYLLSLKSRKDPQRSTPTFCFIILLASGDKRQPGLVPPTLTAPVILNLRGGSLCFRPPARRQREMSEPQRLRIPAQQGSQKRNITGFPTDRKFCGVLQFMICLPADTPLPVKVGVFIYPTLIKPLRDCLVFRSGLTLLNNGCPPGKAYGSGTLIHFMPP